jgi:sugar O-acyltransferase (sialic acid O-acetyltransferase NeuD family)
MELLTIVGAGGHAKVVVAAALAAGFAEITLVDRSEALHGTTLLGVEVTGPAEPVLADPEALAVLAIGDNAARARLAAGAACRFATIVHPSATVHASSVLGPGTVVFAGAVIQPEARLGAHCIVNTGASIDHDCVLGDAVHVAPGTRLGGAVALGAGVFVGIGAVVTPGRSIGAGTVVGAGAAVVRDLPEGITAAGVPARSIQPAFNDSAKR